MTQAMPNRLGGPERQEASNHYSTGFEKGRGPRNYIKLRAEGGIRLISIKLVHTIGGAHRWKRRMNRCYYSTSYCFGIFNEANRKQVGISMFPFAQEGGGSGRIKL
jgi:hypothetical protein